jgi:hypothetical protein
MKKLALLLLLFGIPLLSSPPVLADDPRAQETLKEARAAIGGEELLAVALGQVVTQQQVITQEKGQASTKQEPQIIPGNGGTKRDPKFNVEVAQPAFTNRHPKILFDEAHLNQGLSNRYADLIALLTKRSTKS